MPYTRVRVGGSIGYIVAVTAAGFMIEAYGTQVIVPLMTTSTLIAVITTFYIYEQPIDRVAKSQKGAFLRLIKEKEIIFFLALAFLSYLAHAPFNVFLQFTYLRRVTLENK